MNISVTTITSSNIRTTATEDLTEFPRVGEFIRRGAVVYRVEIIVHVPASEAAGYVAEIQAFQSFAN